MTVFKLPLKEIKTNESLFHIDDSFIVLEGKTTLDIYDSCKFSFEKIYTYEKKSGVRLVFSMGSTLFFRDNSSVFKAGDIYSLDMTTGEVNELGGADFKLSTYLGTREGISYFNHDLGHIVRLNSESANKLEFSVVRSIDYPANNPLLYSSTIVTSRIGLNSMVEAHDYTGELLWSKDLEEFGLFAHEENYNGASEIKPCTCSYKEDVLINVFPYRLVSINAQNGDLNWVLPDVVDKQWIIGNEGKVYSVFKGNLKVVDAESGELLLDKPINSDWVQAEKDTLNLFQVNVSSTHLWCGFLGHGLCAVNLETAEIDWHEFDGQSLNRKPIIKNNRIYVQLMSGGIGLDNEGTQEYILEGEGGYIEDSDNEFIVF